MTKQKKTALTKAEKRAIMDKYPTVPASEYFTDQEWANLMFATATEAREICHKVAERHGLGLGEYLKNDNKKD